MRPQTPDLTLSTATVTDGDSNWSAVCSSLSKPTAQQTFSFFYHPDSSTVSDGTVISAGGVSHQYTVTSISLENAGYYSCSVSVPTASSYRGTTRQLRGDQNSQNLHIPLNFTLSIFISFRLY